MKKNYSKEQLDAAKKMGVSLPKEAKKANKMHDPNFNDMTGPASSNGPTDQGKRMRDAAAEERNIRKSKETPQKTFPTGKEAYQNKKSSK